MHTSGPRVVVTGYIGLLPVGGGTWDYIQYPVGLRELGCDVLYLEDTQRWPIFQHQEGGEMSCSANVAYLASAMRRFGMEDRWCYRDELTGRYFGTPRNEVLHFCRTADIFLNLSCSTPLREEYAAIPIRALIDTDPMFTQVQCVTGLNMRGKRSAIPDLVADHTHLFSFGESLGRADCEVPCVGLRWFPTRQPVVLRYWPETPLPSRGAFTSVFNWSVAKDFEFQSRQWGQKNVEFLRFLQIPRRLPDVTFTIGVGQTLGEPFPSDAVEREGWRVVNAQSIAYDAESYQSFIQSSGAEFSVAKHTYIQANTGWFSCRSACYLASGRPVVTQDTGWSANLPHGCGLYAFTDAESALDAIQRIVQEPERNARAARRIAEEHFDSHKVLSGLMKQLEA